MFKQPLIIAALIGLIVTSCGGNLKKAESLKIFGTYEGDVPCADCPGISQKLILRADNTYTMESIYQGDGDSGRKPFIDNGTFKVENGKVILSIQDAPTMYIIGDGYVEQLDIEGNKIEGDLNHKLRKK